MVGLISIMTYYTYIYIERERTQFLMVSSHYHHYILGTPTISPLMIDGVFNRYFQTNLAMKTPEIPLKSSHEISHDFRRCCYLSHECAYVLYIVYTLQCVHNVLP